MKCSRSSATFLSTCRPMYSRGGLGACRSWDSKALLHAFTAALGTLSAQPELSSGVKGDAAMPRIRMNVRDALQSPEIRKACAVLDHVNAATMLLTELPPPVVEALRDEFEKMANERTGPRGELKRAWVAYTEQALADARLRDRQDTFGMYSELR